MFGGVGKRLTARKRPRLPKDVVVGYGVVSTRLSEGDLDFKAHLKNLFNVAPWSVLRTNKRGPARLCCLFRDIGLWFEGFNVFRGLQIGHHSKGTV